ncbi:TPA: hypothetical protein ACKQPR_000010 [Serratia odorifera]|nr:hypothetical protein [Serratia odorifera]
MSLLYIQLSGLVLFFFSFLFFCKKIGVNISAPSSMSMFIDSIFFVFEGNKATLIGRMILLFIIPLSFIVRNFHDDKNSYLLVFICGAWLLLLYCYYYRVSIQPGKIKSSALFSEVIFSRRQGVRGVLLWGIRLLYIAGFYLHFTLM